MTTVIGTFKHPEKPPNYWIAAKRQLGMSDPALFRIWWRTYTDQKRLLAWMTAPERDWLDNGMEKPEQLR